MGFPNGEIFSVENTPATPLIKAVLEVFAARFLAMPAAIRVALPGSTVDVRGRDYCETLGFSQAALHDLPKIILADVHPGECKIIFVETITDEYQGRGFTNERKQKVLSLALATGITASSVLFVSAFRDRSQPLFLGLVASLAWGTCVWFQNEQEKLLMFSDGQAADAPSLLGHRQSHSA